MSVAGSHSSTSSSRSLRRSRVAEADAPSPHYDLTAVAHELVEPMLSMDCQRDVMALLCERGTLVVRDTSSDAPPLTAVVRNPHRVFLDPTGAHLLVAASDGEMHYFAAPPRRGAATRFHLQPRGAAGGGAGGGAGPGAAECVCWLPPGDLLLRCLVGARAGGCVFEVRVAAADGAARASCRQCLRLPLGARRGGPVAGIAAEAAGGRAVVLLATPSRLFRVAGAGDPVALLDAAAADPSRVVVARDFAAAAAAPGAARGAVALFRPGAGAAAQAYVWAGEGGVVHGLFGRAPRSCGGLRAAEAALLLPRRAEECVANEQLLALHRVRPQPRAEAQPHGVPVGQVPMEVALTAFHMVLLYSDRLIVLNHPAGLTWRGAASTLQGEDPFACEIADRIRFDPFRGSRKPRELRGIVRDVAARKVYIFSESLIWELELEQEHRRQWRLFLDRAINTAESPYLRTRFFEAAYQLSMYSASAKRLVQLLRGKFLLQIGAHHHAADVLADCDNFEAVYPMLVALRNRDLLRLYVERRYQFLARRAADLSEALPQLACLLALTVVQRLDHITRSESTDGGCAAATCELKDIIASAIADQPLLFDSSPAYDELIGQMLEAQGRPELALFYAERRDKLHYLLTHHVAHRAYVKAAEILAAHSRRADVLEAWYEFAPVLMRKCPISLMAAMLRAVARDAQGAPHMLLRLERLIPLFIQYRVDMNEDPNNGEHQVIVFLERCITKFDCVSTVVHNYYLSLLAQNDPDRLDEFIETSPFYTVDFALRRCLEARRYRQCVGLYRRLHLYEDAIRTLLDCSADPTMNSDDPLQWPGLQSAKSLLTTIPEGMDSVTLKKLWLILAQYVVGKNSTRVALAVVEDSGGILKLEDILEHISDSTVVQKFKDAICKGLDAYTMSIAELKERQKEASQISESLKQEIEQLPHRFGYVTARQRCLLCHRSLLHGSAPFFIYPNCRHAVHEACAVAKVDEIGGLEAFFADEGLPRQFFDGVSSSTDLARMDCVLCGEAAILEIDIPLCVEDSSWSVA